MPQPEAKFKKVIQRRLKAVLERRKLRYKLTWNAGGYGISTVDLTGVIAGHAVAVEVKRADGKRTKLTARQISDLRDYAEAGAFAMVVDSEQSLSIFLAWVEILEPRSVCAPEVIKALIEQ